MVQQQTQFEALPLDRQHRQRNLSFALMLLAILVLGICSIFWAEKLPVNGGFGWDGQIYGSVAQQMNLHTLDRYYFNRILPSTIVHYALVLLRQPLDNQHVIIAFGFLNLSMLLLACVLYRFIAGKIALGNAGFWFGFAAIFVNFECCKGFWYYPVQTDTTALALSLAMLCCYLSNQPFLLFIAALAGAFTFPTLIYAGIFLLAFPRQAIAEQLTRAPKWIAMGFAAAFLAASVYLFYLRHDSVGDSLAQPIYAALPLSLALCAFYIYKASTQLLSGIAFRTWFKSLSFRRAALAVLLFIAATLPAYFWADPGPSDVTMRGTLRDIVMRSAVKPLVFWVSHPLYFGPAFLLLLFYWKPFTRIIRENGVGLVLVVFMGIVTSLTPESRQSTPVYAMAMPFLALLVGNLALTHRFFELFAALALASTRIWMRMGVPAYDDHQYLRFPFQKLFMNAGPWMNNRMYVLQGVIVLIAVLLLYACAKSADKGEVK